MFSFLKSLLSTKDETFIRRWAKEAKNRAKTSSNPDLNVVFGAIVFAIADYMDTNDLKPFLKYGAVSKESLSILQSDRALFFMSCYVMAMLKLWSNKEKKPPKDAETLYANFVYLFSKSFDQDIKIIGPQFLTKTNQYITAVKKSEDAIERVTDDLCELASIEDRVMGRLIVHTTAMTWATSYMNVIIDMMETYYALTPEFANQ